MRGPALPPAGWYQDPHGPADQLRWWDGVRWTAHVQPAASRTRGTPWAPVVVAVVAVVILGMFGMFGALLAGIDSSHTAASGVSATPSKASNPHGRPKADRRPQSSPTAGPKPSKAADTVKPRSTRKPVRTYYVSRIVDGDTLELGNGETVRLVGIDTPERGQCGYQEASDNLARLVLGKRVRLGISDEDRDRYGRLLRYVNVGSVDAGLRLLRNGMAIARYDSRDGYGFHPREPVYIRADGASRNFTCPKPAPSPRRFTGGGGGNCMSGYTPCLPVTGDLDCADVSEPVRVSGSDPYRLDADGDGWGCES